MEGRGLDGDVVSMERTGLYGGTYKSEVEENDGYGQESVEEEGDEEEEVEQKEAQTADELPGDDKWHYAPQLTPSPSPSQRILVSRPQTSSKPQQLQQQTNQQHHHRWNELFQTALEQPGVTPEDSEERLESLQSLTESFISSTKPIAKLIIDEEDLPDTCQKTIPPLGWGFAGGKKYLHSGIFFKFAVDQKDLYGGDRFSMKAAGHELKSLQSIASCNISHLHFPLQVNVDYLGRRLSASSILPISSPLPSSSALIPSSSSSASLGSSSSSLSTLVYGSDDGGRTVHSSSLGMNQMMQSLAERLNLKGHWTGVGKEKKFLYGPGDLEGHLGKDGRFYVLDTARLFPPEPPMTSSFSSSFSSTSTSTSSSFHPGMILYRLLRPEFVKENAVPLSSDAFTRWGSSDAKVHNRGVREAFQRLTDIVIPRLATGLERRYGHSSHSIEVNRDLLTQEFHYEGVNMRYLGKVRAKISFSNLKQLLLAEMVARATKNILKDRLRLLKSTAISEHRMLAVNTFNILLGYQQSDTFWADLQQDLERSFPQALSLDEQRQSLPNLVAPSLSWLFARLQDLSEIRFSRTNLDTLSFTFANPHLSDQDLISLGVRVKSIVVAPFIQALRDQGRGSEAEEFYKKELEMREFALGPSHPNVASTLENFAIFLEKEMKDRERAEEMLKRALYIREGLTEMKELSGGEDKESGQALRQEAKLNAANTHQLFAQFERNRGNFEVADAFMKRSVKLKEEVLGKEHIMLPGDLNFRAGIKKNLGMYNKAAKLYQRSMAIIESTRSKGEEKEKGNEIGEKRTSFSRRRGVSNQHQLVEAIVEHSRIQLHLAIMHDISRQQKRALRIAESIIPAPKSLLAVIYNNVAIVKITQGKFEKAKEVVMKALSVREKALGTHHSHFAHTLGILGQLHLFNQNFLDAETALLKALEIYQMNKLPETHPSIVTAQANIARCYCEQQKIDEALLRLSEIISTLVKEKKQTTIQFATLCIDYAAVLFELWKKEQEASVQVQIIRLLETAFDIQKANLDSEHPLLSFTSHLLKTVTPQELFPVRSSFAEEEQICESLMKMTERVSTGNLTVYRQLALLDSSSPSSGDSRSSMSSSSSSTPLNTVYEDTDSHIATLIAESKNKLETALQREKKHLEKLETDRREIEEAQLRIQVLESVAILRF